MALINVILDNPALWNRRLHDGRDLREAMQSLSAANGDIHQRLLAQRGNWPIGWLELPAGGDWYNESVRLAEQYAAEFDTLIVCGIGGSALGTQAVFSALDNPALPLANVYVLDNVDPTQIAWLSQRVNWESTALNVISKSGETLETMSGFFYLLRLMELSGLDQSEVSRRVIATTDASKGLLRTLANERGWATLPVPSDVGGRFSVFSPVGVFPLAFAGVNTDSLLHGARGWQEAILLKPLEQNPAWQLAALQYLLHTGGGISNVVQYVYGDPLVLLCDWFRQLWAESLAKANQLDGQPGLGCLTPLTARGTTDQHSQNQLYMEGPDDKLYCFITSHDWEVSPIIEDSGLPAAFQYLSGLDFGRILDACREGTRDALIEAGRPVFEINFPNLSTHSVGAYLQLWMLATAYAGILYNVNPFDQPGVERSKVLTRGKFQH